MTTKFGRDFFGKLFERTVYYYILIMFSPRMYAAYMSLHGLYIITVFLIPSAAVYCFYGRHIDKIADLNLNQEQTRLVASRNPAWLSILYLWYWMDIIACVVPFISLYMLSEQNSSGQRRSVFVE